MQHFSYRGCFKPELPRRYIERFTQSSDVVYDPFVGRGTTLLEAASMGRIGWGSDINPLSVKLIEPRFAIWKLQIPDLTFTGPLPSDLLEFFHPDTLREIMAVRERGDGWVKLLTASKLTGHSSGYLSVYTLPPNQAVTAIAQRRMNEKRGQRPTYRSLRDAVTSRHTDYLGPGLQGRVWTCDASQTGLQECSVDLIITSPPFLGVIDYAQDNWLRNWFFDVVAVIPDLSDTLVWSLKMRQVLREMFRVLKPSKHLCFEVGDIKKVNLESIIIPLGKTIGFEFVSLEIDDTPFNRTADIWSTGGTKTNRVCIFRKPT